MNHSSDNHIAETVLKGLAGDGERPATSTAAASHVRLIAAADRDPGWGSALIRSLPRGGEGTLIRRLRSPKVKNRVRAKTGFLNGVTSLSGRVVSTRGHRYAFAILIEAENTAGGRRLQDAVVNQLARGLEDPPPRSATR